MYLKKSVRVSLGRQLLAPNRRAFHQRESSCSCIWNNCHRMGTSYVEERIKGFYLQRVGEIETETRAFCATTSTSIVPTVWNLEENGRAVRASHRLLISSSEPPGSYEVRVKLLHDAHKLLKCDGRKSYVFPRVWLLPTFSRKGSMVMWT